MRQRSIALIEQAKQAEAVGLQSLWISEHFYPWNDEQGQSPFVWEVIGAPSEVTSLTHRHRGDLSDDADPSRCHRPGRCDRRRPAPGRFVLGVGSGEALNEHIFGDP